MLSITIVALLMVAVGAATKSSVQGFTENEKIARAEQAARAILRRMTRQLRTAGQADFTQSVQSGYNVTTLTITDPQDGSNLVEIRYVWQTPVGTTDGKLYYQYQQEGGTLQTPDLAMLGEESDLSVTSFDLTLIVEESNPKSCKVELGLAVGDHTLSTSAAVTLRNWKY